MPPATSRCPAPTKWSSSPSHGWGCATCRRQSMPNLARLAERGAIASMRVKTGGSVPNATEAYASLGAGEPLGTGSSGTAAYDSGEMTQGATALQGQQLRTGKALQGSVVVPAMPTLASSTRVAGAGAGALGSLLQSSGHRTAVVGNADTLPLTGEANRLAPAAVAIADRDGVIDAGTVSPDLNVRNQRAPFGLSVDTGRFVSAVTGALGDADVVVADPGETTRAADYLTSQTPSQGARARTAALTRTDRVLAALDRRLPPRTLLLVVGLTPGGGQWALTPLVASGQGVRTGRLVSPSTHHAGLATLSDLAPTILHALGAPDSTALRGNALRLVPGSTSWAPLRSLDDAARVAGDDQPQHDHRVHRPAGVAVRGRDGGAAAVGLGVVVLSAARGRGAGVRGLAARDVLGPGLGAGELARNGDDPPHLVAGRGGSARGAAAARPPPRPATPHLCADDCDDRARPRHRRAPHVGKLLRLLARHGQPLHRHRQRNVRNPRGLHGGDLRGAPRSGRSSPGRLVGGGDGGHHRGGGRRGPLDGGGCGRHPHPGPGPEPHAVGVDRAQGPSQDRGAGMRRGAARAPCGGRGRSAPRTRPAHAHRPVLPGGRLGQRPAVHQHDQSQVVDEHADLRADRLGVDGADHRRVRGVRAGRRQGVAAVAARRVAAPDRRRGGTGDGDRGLAPQRLRRRGHGPGVRLPGPAPATPGAPGPRRAPDARTHPMPQLQEAT